MTRVRVVPPIVLASQSPRRAQLMELIGLPFMVEPADVDETYPAGEAPEAHAGRLAREKAEVVAARRPEALVVGSDTVVVVDGEVLGKPADREQALAMLMRLQGREHRVLTGVAVVAPAVVGGDAADGERSWGWDRVASLEGDRRSASGVEAVRVWFRAFDEATALEYIATGEPMDKAGAYGIQGYGATIVERVDGDYFAVMGLALGRMIGLFRELGWRYNFRGLEPL